MLVAMILVCNFLFCSIRLFRAVELLSPFSCSHEDASVYALIHNKSKWLDYFGENLFKQFSRYVIVTTAVFFILDQILI